MSILYFILAWSKNFIILQKSDVVEPKCIELKVAMTRAKKGQKWRLNKFCRLFTCFGFVYRLDAEYHTEVIRSYTNWKPKIWVNFPKTDGSTHTLVWRVLRAAASWCDDERFAESNFRATAKPNFPLIPCRHVWKVKTFTVERCSPRKWKRKLFAKLFLHAFGSSRVGCAPRFQK